MEKSNYGDGGHGGVEGSDERNEIGIGGGTQQAQQTRINAEKFKPASKGANKRVTEADVKRATEVRGYLRDQNMICIEFKAPTRVALGHLNEDWGFAMGFAPRCQELRGFQEVYDVRTSGGRFDGVKQKAFFPETGGTV